MTESHVFVLVVAGLYAALMVIALLVQVRRASVERRLMRMANQVALTVPDHLEDELLRHVSRRARAWLLGNAVGVLGIAMPVFLIAPELFGPFGIAAAVLGFASGAAASVGVALIDRRRGSFGALTVARLGGPTIRDLVPLRPVIATTVVAVIALAISATILLDPRPADGFVDDLRFGAVALALGSLVGLVGWWLAARAIAGKRPISGDIATLAWSDALRAESIRDLLLLPFISALLSVQIGAPALTRIVAPDAPEITEIARAAGLYGSLAIVIAMGLLWFDRRSAQHFQRRLWPELEVEPAEPATGDGRSGAPS